MVWGKMTYKNGKLMGKGEDLCDVKEKTEDVVGACCVKEIT